MCAAMCDASRNPHVLTNAAAAPPAAPKPRLLPPKHPHTPVSDPLPQSPTKAPGETLRIRRKSLRRSLEFARAVQHNKARVLKHKEDERKRGGLCGEEGGGWKEREERTGEEEELGID